MVKSAKSNILFEQNLDPCPGCGRSDRLKISRRVITFNDMHEKDQVICDRCGWRGPEGDSTAAARQFWDHRRDQRSWVRMAIEALEKIQRENYGWSSKVHPDAREKWERYQRAIDLLCGLRIGSNEK